MWGDAGSESVAGTDSWTGCLQLCVIHAPPPLPRTCWAGTAPQSPTLFCHQKLKGVVSNARFNHSADWHVKEDYFGARGSAFPSRVNCGNATDMLEGKNATQDFDRCKG